MSWRGLFLGFVAGLMLGIIIHEPKLGMVGGALLGCCWGSVLVLRGKLDQQIEEQKRLEKSRVVLQERLRKMENRLADLEAEPRRGAGFTPRVEEQPNPEADAAQSHFSEAEEAQNEAQAPAVSLPVDSRDSSLILQHSTPAHEAPSPSKAYLAAKLSATPRMPPPPPPPKEPSLIERALGAAKAWLLGGNTVARAGSILVFLGLAFLLKYVSGQVVVPLEIRYAGVALVAIIGLMLGWRLRIKSRSYGLLLQGTAVGILYLTTFSALRLHQEPLLPAGLGLAILVAVVVLSAVLSVTQDALILALAGAAGGFAAPVLASSGGGNMVGLFTYMALLNSGILAMAWFKAWRPLNLVGFMGTFSIGLAWGFRSYDPLQHYFAAQFFLILFFLAYLAISLLFVRRWLLDDPMAPRTRNQEDWLRWFAQQGGRTPRYIDASLLFGVPVAGFGIQCRLMAEFEYGLALSSLSLGFIYIALAKIAHTRNSAGLRFLVEVLLALGLIFSSLAIPLGLSAQWTSAAWAVEAAGIYWMGHRQNRPYYRAFAVFLQAGALLNYLNTVKPHAETLLGGSWLGALLLGLAMICNALVLRRARSKDWDRQLGPLFSTMGLWCIYLLAPLIFSASGTSMVLALAGVATLGLALKFRLEGWMANAFFVQLAAGAVFLMNLSVRGDNITGAVLGAGDAGGKSLFVALLVGGASLASVSVAIREARRSANPALERAMAWFMLFGLSFLCLGVLFVLPWSTVTAVWGACGFLLLYLALQLVLIPAFWFAIGLEVIAGVSFLLTVGPYLSFSYRGLASDLVAFGHSGFWAPTVLGVAVFLMGWRLQALARSDSNPGEPRLHNFNPSPSGVADAHQAHPISISTQRMLANLSVIWAMGWWSFAWCGELFRIFPPESARHLVLLAAVVTVLPLIWIARRWVWPALVGAASFIWPLTAMVAGADFATELHPFGLWGAPAYGLTLLAGLLLLRVSPILPRLGNQALHLVGLWVTLLVLSLECRHGFLWFSQAESSWRWLGWTLPLMVWLLWSARRQPPTWWPAKDEPSLYRDVATLPLLFIVLIWVFFSAIGSAGLATPLPYVPIFNPLELAQVLVLVAGGLWLRRPEGCAKRSVPSAQLVPMIRWIMVALAFLVYTAMVARANHHYAEVPFIFRDLVRSLTVQASISIAWSLCAFGLMISGHKWALRQVWVTGAILIFVVVVKLFFVELSGTGSLERIISFLGVGGLLLVVGYFAPLPPHTVDNRAEVQS